MIFIRRKDAKSINSVVSIRNGKFHLPNLLICAKIAHIIYFEKTIQIITYDDKIHPIFGKIGELERKNIPFILLIDKKCEIDVSKEYTAVINASCLTYRVLDDFFPEVGSIIEKSKSELFNTIVKESMDDSGAGETFSGKLDYFKRIAAHDGLITKDIVFIAMSSKDGEIVNLNEGLGKNYNEGKIWHYNEEYDYNVREVELITTASGIDPVSAFAFEYETKGAYITAHSLRAFTTNELVEIITKYPILFADIVNKGRSRHNKISYDMLPSLKEDEEDERTFQDILKEEAEEREFDAPADCKMCDYCENYVPRDEIETVMINNGWLDICEPCMPKPYERDSYREY